jgi:hypothetical protein
MAVTINELRRVVFTTDVVLPDPTGINKKPPSTVVVKNEPKLDLDVPVRMSAAEGQGCYIVPEDLQIQDSTIQNFLPLTLGEAILGLGIVCTIYGATLTECLLEQVGGLKGLSRRYQEIVQDLQIKGELQLSRQVFPVTIGNWHIALNGLANMPDNLQAGSKQTWTYCQLLMIWVAWIESSNKLPGQADDTEQLFDIVRTALQFRNANFANMVGSSGLM